MISLENIKHLLEMGENPVKMNRVYGSNLINRYRLLEEIYVSLSNGYTILIPKGYTWDLSSVPRIFWWLLPPDGDFQIASLIHDYLYENKIGTRKNADKEMLKWSRVLSGTGKISLRNIDNYTRYIAVRLFGWIVWNKKN